MKTITIAVLCLAIFISGNCQANELNRGQIINSIDQKGKDNCTQVKVSLVEILGSITVDAKKPSNIIFAKIVQKPEDQG